MKTAVFAVVVVLGACAGTMTSHELSDARTEYIRVSQGPAATYAPGDLAQARIALDEADRAYRRAPNAQHTRDLAVEARRLADVAEARAIDVQRSGRPVGGVRVSYQPAPAQVTRVQITQPAGVDPAEAQRQAAAAAAANARANAAERARDAEAARLAEAERQRDSEAAQRAAAERARDAEAAQRADAERRASDIERDLQSIAIVRETERGLVVSMQGDVLFEFDRTTLLPTARVKLGQLADVLNKTDIGLAVEGHTDSVGSDAYNQDLSYRRAMAVRDFLISRGVDAARLQIAGFGRTRPLADNRSPEGRAMNRRVEIIIETKNMAHR
jgi:outer membrane protein OmpA-like peptidoglycan-associated protein